MELIERNHDLYCVKSQIAKMLWEHASNNGDGHNGLAQREIASTLGTGWDTVHIALKSLINDGVIKIDRNRIILNKELIQKAAEAA